jgi:hypothetical protein
MDPLGFALENYDAIGHWQVISDGARVDASASLPDGTIFQGAAGLKNVLAGRREAFADIFTQKMMTYALGREVEYYDSPAIRKIIRGAAGSNYRWSAIITGIVESLPFQMSVVRGGPEKPEKTVAQLENQSAGREGDR